MSDSPQYDTTGKLTQCSIIRKIRITLRNLNQNRNYFNPLVSSPRSYDEKNWRSKISLECPFNRIRKSHMTPRTMILWRVNLLGSDTPHEPISCSLIYSPSQSSWVWYPPQVNLHGSDIPQKLISLGLITKLVHLMQSDLPHESISSGLITQ